MGQAQWKLENVKCMMPVLLPVMPDSMLHLQMDATEDYSEFYQETMENLVLRAENDCAARGANAIRAPRCLCAAAGRVAHVGI